MRLLSSALSCLLVLSILVLPAACLNVSALSPHNVFSRYISAKLARSHRAQLVSKVSSNHIPLPPNVTDPETGMTELQIRALILNRPSNVSHSHKHPYVSGHTFNPFVNRRRHRATATAIDTTAHSKKVASSSLHSAHIPRKAPFRPVQNPPHHPSVHVANHHPSVSHVSPSRHHPAAHVIHGDDHGQTDLFDPEDDTEEDIDTHQRIHDSRHHPPQDHPQIHHSVHSPTPPSERTRLGQSLFALMLSVTVISLIIGMSSRGSCTSSVRDYHLIRLLRKITPMSRQLDRSV